MDASAPIRKAPMLPASCEGVRASDIARRRSRGRMRSGVTKKIRPDRIVVAIRSKSQLDRC